MGTKGYGLIYRISYANNNIYVYKTVGVREFDDRLELCKWCAKCLSDPKIHMGCNLIPATRERYREFGNYRLSVNLFTAVNSPVQDDSRKSPSLCFVI